MNLESPLHVNKHKKKNGEECGCMGAFFSLSTSYLGDPRVALKVASQVFQAVRECSVWEVRGTSIGLVL